MSCPTSQIPSASLIFLHRQFPSSSRVLPSSRPLIRFPCSRIQVPFLWICFCNSFPFMVTPQLSSSDPFSGLFPSSFFLTPLHRVIEGDSREPLLFSSLQWHRFFFLVVGFIPRSPDSSNSLVFLARFISLAPLPFRSKESFSSTPSFYPWIIRPFSFTFDLPLSASCDWRSQASEDRSFLRRL